MKGGDLMKNLLWLGQFGCLRILLDDEINDDNNNNDDKDVVQQSDLIGGGGPPRKCCNDTSYKFEKERNIRHAMLEMEGTLEIGCYTDKTSEQCLKTTKYNTDTYP